MANQLKHRNGNYMDTVKIVDEWIEEYSRDYIRGGMFATGRAKLTVLRQLREDIQSRLDSITKEEQIKYHQEQIARLTAELGVI